MIFLSTHWRGAKFSPKLKRNPLYNVKKHAVPHNLLIINYKKKANREKMGGYQLIPVEKNFLFHYNIEFEIPVKKEEV